MSKRCCAEMCFNSQTVNKNVSYFGFPKYEEFAVKWAMAANRSDLLEKKMTCITKYYLCSEHFSDDCFVDPPQNTRLKRSMCPINIPIPTIFKSNLGKYIPSAKRNASENEFPAKRTPNYGPINDFSSMNRSLEGISIESMSVFHDHYNYPDISGCAGSFFNDISVNINENSLDNIIDCNPHPIPGITSCSVCRLCAKAYSSDEPLIDFTTDPGIYETLDTILPNQIKSEDHLSKLACTNCLDKLNTCINIINSFKNAQIEMKQIYGIN